MQLERDMIGLPEPQKFELRRVLEHEEFLLQKESRKKITASDFESLAVIGRGAFGEVRLVRRKGKRGDPQTGQILALKSMVRAQTFLYVYILEGMLAGIRAVLFSHNRASTLLPVIAEKGKHDPQEPSESRQI
jgi:hypothetical protein